jgi:hypothetical protein
MTDNKHPITPPPELVQQWFLGARAMPVDQWVTDVATQAAQWGADTELEACCHCFARDLRESLALELRARRRPKPPSLKEQALALVEQHEDGWRPSPKDWDTIRRALEQLPDSIVVFPSSC